MIETLLIIEDEKLLGSELSRHYRALGWEVVLADTLAAAKTLLLKKTHRAAADSFRHEFTGR